MKFSGLGVLVFGIRFGFLKPSNNQQILAKYKGWAQLVNVSNKKVYKTILNSWYNRTYLSIFLLEYTTSNLKWMLCTLVNYCKLINGLKYR